MASNIAPNKPANWPPNHVSSRPRGVGLPPGRRLALCHAAHANAMAASGSRTPSPACRASRSLSHGRPTPAFLLMPAALATALHESGWVFYQMHNAVEDPLGCAVGHDGRGRGRLGGRLPMGGQSSKQRGEASAASSRPSHGRRREPRQSIRKADFGSPLEQLASAGNVGFALLRVVLRRGFEHHFALRRRGADDFRRRTQRCRSSNT